MIWSARGNPEGSQTLGFEECIGVFQGMPGKWKSLSKMTKVHTAHAHDKPQLCNNSGLQNSWGGGKLACTQGSGKVAALSHLFLHLAWQNHEVMDGECCWGTGTGLAVALITISMNYGIT
jgi:hypothetical protein